MARSRRKPKTKAAARKPAEQLVNDFTANHGDYVDGSVVDLDGSLGGKRMSIVKVKLNRGGTAVDRWIVGDKSGDIFGESQQMAIRYCRNLWHKADGGMSAVDPSADKVDAPLGWAQSEAIDELADIKKRIPRMYYEVFENVCRFDEEAGVAGSRLATNARSAIDAAKTTVALVASLIAMRNGL